MDNNRFFSLSDITNRIQQILQPHIGKNFWVKAEISSGRERGGSFYCDLVESDDSGKFRAQMRCTIWNRDLKSIRKKFKEHDLDLVLDDGTAVGFQCSLQFHPQFGLSLKAVAADPSFALGELELKTSILHAYGHSGQYPRFFLSLLLIDEAAKRPLSMAALRMCCSKTPWQLIQYVFKINHDISMQEIFCINCPATR